MQDKQKLSRATKIWMTTSMLFLHSASRRRASYKIPVTMTSALMSSPRSDAVAKVADKQRKLKNEWQHRVLGAEWRHILAGVLREPEAVESGDLEALRRREEAKDTDHCEAAVVDLGPERLLLTLLVQVLREPEGVPQIQ